MQDTIRVESAQQMPDWVKASLKLLLLDPIFAAQLANPKLRITLHDGVLSMGSINGSSPISNPSYSATLWVARPRYRLISFTTVPLLSQIAAPQPAAPRITAGRAVDHQPPRGVRFRHE
jgi:hypothetical protein